MQKAIFSRIDLNNADNDLAQEYLSCIRDLLHLHDVGPQSIYTAYEYIKISALAECLLLYISDSAAIPSGFLQRRKSRPSS